MACTRLLSSSRSAPALDHCHHSPWQWKQSVTTCAESFCVHTLYASCVLHVLAWSQGFGGLPMTLDFNDNIQLVSVQQTLLRGGCVINQIPVTTWLLYFSQHWYHSMLDAVQQQLTQLNQLNCYWQCVSRVLSCHVDCGWAVLLDLVEVKRECTETMNLVIGQCWRCICQSWRAIAFSKRLDQQLFVTFIALIVHHLLFNGKHLWWMTFRHTTWPQAPAYNTDALAHISQTCENFMLEHTTPAISCKAH